MSGTLPREQRHDVFRFFAQPADDAANGMSSTVHNAITTTTHLEPR